MGGASQALWPDCVAGLGGALTCGRVGVRRVVPGGGGGARHPPRCVSSRPRRSGLGGRRRGTARRATYGPPPTPRARPAPQPTTAGRRVLRSTPFGGGRAAPPLGLRSAFCSLLTPPHPSLRPSDGADGRRAPPQTGARPAAARLCPVSPAADAAPTRRGATQWPPPTAASSLTPPPPVTRRRLGHRARGKAGLTGRPLPAAARRLDTRRAGRGPRVGASGQTWG